MIGRARREAAAVRRERRPHRPHAGCPHVHDEMTAASHRIEALRVEMHDHYLDWLATGVRYPYDAAREAFAAAWVEHARLQAIYHGEPTA